MSIKFYQDGETKRRIENSISFSESFPLEASIDKGMDEMTLRQIAEQLTRQFSTRGAVGTTLIEIRFSMIFDSK